MTDQRDVFEYDVAVSVAEADQAIARQLMDQLKNKNKKVFLDVYKQGDSWGRDVIDHLVNLYARKSRYCVLLISAQYPLKAWTRAERKSAWEHALRDPEEYILPIRLDDTDVTGMTEVKGYRDLRQGSLESLVEFIEGKLHASKSRPGPPVQSHDLRSGNVPSSDSDSRNE